MALFQVSVLKNYLKLQDDHAVDKAYKSFTSYFHHPEIQENIRKSKEEQFQATFLHELFVKVLGYTLNPNPDYNLTTEFRNESNNRKADGAILKDGSAIGVIELKGTNTKHLEGIRQQAFDYKANQKHCVYVITSNFEKLRFYIQDATEFLEFDLFELNRKDFGLLWLCLHKENILSSLPLKIKEASLGEEEEITKEFYKDYSLFKRELFRDLVQRNVERLKNEPTGYESDAHPPSQMDRDVSGSEVDTEAEKDIKLNLFKKSQKLIDRFLFIFFAEDRGLLPPNAIVNILAEWNQLKDLDAEIPLYGRFKQYFNYLNHGRPANGNRPEIYAYNGGLFKPDELLDGLEIDDELLNRHTSKLAKYDFESQVDVNILGHIFENSLNEIESVSAEIEGGEFDKQKSKRKKDGVFYTPKYITKYIVENTIGRLCEEKKSELGFREEEYFKGRKRRPKDTLEGLVKILDDYRDWLLQLTICDPACGSGAFLNQALDFLIKEHRYIDEMKSKLLGGSIILSDIENTILERNIYGVDINEESVEIAKLSLWLRTALPNRKLNDLSGNIKCGNSLIDDETVAGNKAFKWEEEFPEVFSKGGFDVVIGNPPYVGEKNNSHIFEDLKKITEWGEFYRRRSNTYYFFIKKGIQLLKRKGIQSLIIPREFTNADWANNVREDILTKSTIKEIIDFRDHKVFSDAGTTSLILTQQKEITEKYKFLYKKIEKTEDIQTSLTNNANGRLIKNEKLEDKDYKPWNFDLFQIDHSKKIMPLGDYFDVSQGLVTGADKVTPKHVSKNLIDESFLGRGIFLLNENIDIKFQKGIPSLNINNIWTVLSEEDISFIKPFCKAENLKNWLVTPTDTYVLYVGGGKLTEKIKLYLLQFEKILLNRSTLDSDKIITLKEFEQFTVEDIKRFYSSAGAVQKIMRRKKWYLPLYERTSVPFEASKIIVNTKNMKGFTFSDAPLYSSGGGLGGQNFIFLKEEFFQSIPLGFRTNAHDFSMYTNALLNSKVISYYIEIGEYNQLSTAKISDLPIVRIDFEKEHDKNIFERIIQAAQNLRSLYCSHFNIVSKFETYIQNIMNISDHQFLQSWNELEFGEFIKQLNKVIKANNKVRLKDGLSPVPELTKKDEFEWMELFEENKQKAVALQREIEKTDKEIDQMVYELYGLTEEEIEIVENSTK